MLSMYIAVAGGRIASFEFAADDWDSVRKQIEESLATLQPAIKMNWCVWFNVYRDQFGPLMLSESYINKENNWKTMNVIDNTPRIALTPSSEDAALALELAPPTE